MGKKITDTGIMLCAAALAVYVAVWLTSPWRWLLFILLLVIAIGALNNLIDQFTTKSVEVKYGISEDEGFTIRELILLDEDEKPIKSWDLAGKTSMVVGKNNEDEPVDVDLEECEYSALIDYQHAVLNYCRDSWYVEDLQSHNGIRIRKIDDGVCYKVMKNLPCRLMPGDMLLIANTKLLLT